MRPLLCTLSLLLFSHTALTQPLYRWQDETGKTHYSDQAPASTSYQPLTLHTGRALYEVEKVLDGDTIIVKGGGKVRLLGINTPEIAHRQHSAEVLGDKAHQRLQQLLKGKRVYLEFDQQRRDRFKRLLAHVTLEDGSNINEQLLREGLARALFLQPNMNHLHDYYRIEAEAQEAKRGIWSLAEFNIRSTQKAKECIKRFCRLRGKVQKIEEKRRYTYLYFPGRLRVSIKNSHLPQFNAAGFDMKKLKGTTMIIRGWLGKRDEEPYLQLQHPLQIQITPP
jgi:micrococcal nuclease